MNEATIRTKDERVFLELKIKKSFQSVVAMFPQYVTQALYAKAYGMSVDTFFGWVEEQERRTPEVVKYFRVTIKQWDAWKWHERVAGMEAGFDPGRARREAFNDVKGWLAHHGDPIDTDVPKIALEFFDEKAQKAMKERLANKRATRNKRKKQEEDEKLEEYRQCVRRIQELTDLRERETEIYERQIRELKSEIETLRRPVSPRKAIKHITLLCPTCGGHVNRGGCLTDDVPYFCPKETCGWKGYS